MRGADTRGCVLVENLEEVDEDGAEKKTRGKRGTKKNYTFQDSNGKTGILVV